MNNLAYKPPYKRNWNLKLRRRMKYYISKRFHVDGQQQYSIKTII